MWVPRIQKRRTTSMGLVKQRLAILGMAVALVGMGYVFRTLLYSPDGRRARNVIVLTSVNEFELGAHHSAESMSSQLRVSPPEAFLEKPGDSAAVREAVLIATA